MLTLDIVILLVVFSGIPLVVLGFALIVNSREYTCYAVGLCLVIFSVLVVGTVHVDRVGEAYTAEPIESSAVESDDIVLDISELSPEAKKRTVRFLHSDTIGWHGYEISIFTNPILTVTKESHGWQLGRPSWTDPFYEHTFVYLRTIDGDYYSITLSNRRTLDGFGTPPNLIGAAILGLSGFVFLIYGIIISNNYDEYRTM